MLIGDIGALLHCTLDELSSMTVDEFDFWSAYLQVKHGEQQSAN